MVGPHDDVRWMPAGSGSFSAEKGGSALDEFGGVYVQGAGKHYQGGERWLPQASFKERDIRPVQFALQGKFLLGQATTDADFSQHLAKGLLYGFAVDRHWRQTLGIA